MTNNAIDLSAAKKPDVGLPQTTENDQPTSSVFSKGFNYDDAIPSVGEFYAGKYWYILRKQIFFVLRRFGLTILWDQTFQIGMGWLSL